MTDILENIELSGEDIPSLYAFRIKGKEAFKGFPTTKNEAFKYTPISNVLSEISFQSSHAQEKEHCDCDKHFLPFEAHEIHFCNGMQHAHIHAIDGVEQMSLSDAFSEHEITPYLNKTDLAQFPLVAFNTAVAEEGLFLRISKTPQKPIALIYNGKSAGFHHIRNFIVLEKGVTAEIFELYQGSGDAYFINTVNEIFVAQNASLTHYMFQNDGLSAVHSSFNHVIVGENGKFQSFSFQKGSKLARHETHVLLQRKNASAVVNASYKAKGQALIDTTTDIEHLSPKTDSRQIVKGVIDQHGHGVFQGKIHIAPMAVQTNGHQIHRALLLSDDAIVDVKPVLEIYADDVKCSHGATSKGLDENELFYLKSRAITENEAQKILTSAFLNEPFAEISNQKVKDYFKEISFEN